MLYPKEPNCLCMVLVIQILIKKKIKEIINLYGPFNIIFVSHAWLYDGYAEDIDPWPKSGLSEVKLNKFMFLNKEYSNLNKKLNWIKK